MPTTQYEIPAFGADPGRVHGWCLEAEQEGRAWLESQRPTRGWEGALQMLSEPDGESSAPVYGESKVGYNKGKRVARELVASLNNFRHEGEFEVTWDRSLYDTARTLTNLDRNWYQWTAAYAAHRAALQYAVGTGTGYLLETWDKQYWSPFRGDIRLSAIAPNDVTFIQLPKDHNIQRAYAVIIREELPINLARAIWSNDNLAFALSLQPDRDQPNWFSRGLAKLQQFVSPALRVGGPGQQQKANSSFPTVDIFHMYVFDSSFNQTPSPIVMGPKGANWSYTVPAIGTPLPTQTINPETGNFFTISATPEHCRLFPLRRYVVYSRTGLGYDGSSPWWHGQVPLARIRFNDWAWEALGSSLVGEAKTMQDGIVALMRGMEDAFAKQLDPPRLEDDSMATSWGQAFTRMRAGATARAPLQQVPNPVVFPLKGADFAVGPEIPAYIQAQEDRIDYMTGVRDLVAVAKANQIPGADTLEKLMEMAGPIVQDLVRQVEEPLMQLGEWRKAYYFQFYTKARMLRFTGPEGVDINIEYKPESLQLLQPNAKPDDLTLQKIGPALDQFQYLVTESGINEIHRMTTKLLYIQLQKIGFPISWWTLAKVCQIPNFGPAPKGTNNELERWVAQKRIELELAIEQQAEATRLLAGAGGPGMEGSPGEMIDRNGEAGAAQAAGGNGNGAGRPPSFQKAPRLESKDGGTRSTISTS